jgi:VPDSG-CTERM motif
MKKAIVLIALVAAGYASTAWSSYAANWNFSYSFTDGLAVSGSFTGTEVGNLVEDINVLSLDFNGVSVQGPLYTATFNGSSWVEGGVESLDGTANDIVFINSDYGAGNYNDTALFYMIPPSLWSGAPDGQAYAYDSTTGILDIDMTANNGTWYLVDPPSPDVPDAGSALLLGGISLMAINLLRRKLA